MKKIYLLILCLAFLGCALFRPEVMPESATSTWNADKPAQTDTGATGFNFTAENFTFQHDMGDHILAYVSGGVYIDGWDDNDPDGVYVKGGCMYGTLANLATLTGSALLNLPIGARYYATDTGVSYIYDGSTWSPLVTSTGIVVDSVMVFGHSVQMAGDIVFSYVAPISMTQNVDTGQVTMTSDRGIYGYHDVETAKGGEYSAPTTLWLGHIDYPEFGTHINSFSYTVSDTFYWMRRVPYNCDITEDIQQYVSMIVDVTPTYLTETVLLDLYIIPSTGGTSYSKQITVTLDDGTNVYDSTDPSLYPFDYIITYPITVTAGWVAKNDWVIYALTRNIDTCGSTVAIEQVRGCGDTYQDEINILHVQERYIYGE